MVDAFATLFARTRAWSDTARTDRWLNDADQRRLESVEQATPGDLFVAGHARPLVVAFFGGTGVGKSSLLNRLVGQPIARTGVERPTSREVTLYVHESVKLADLPPELPVDLVHRERHSSDARRDVVWIDAPDIDSTHEENRRCALRWLPHIDLLIYVVSPERYRDDVGWRVLLERGQKHGWMFVMNRWDEGDASQRDHFARMLRGAGFDAPLLLSTCCVHTTPPLPTPDQFDEIEDTICNLLREHGLRELERLGHRARLLELRTAVNAVLPRFGEPRHWDDLAAASEEHWQRTRVAILAGVEWPLRTVAGRLAARESDVFGKIVRQVKRAAATDNEQNRDRNGAATPPAAQDDPKPDTRAADLTRAADTLWDDWTQAKVDAGLDAIEVELRRLHVAANPLRKRLDETAQMAGKTVTECIQDHLRTALASPGTVLERLLRRCTGFLMIFLPAVALAWTAWIVVRRYYLATTGAGDFLGVPFAVHSVVLLLLAWGLPFLLDRKLRPSLERIALRAMRQGFAEGLDTLGTHLTTALQESARAANNYRAQGKALVADVSQVAIQPIDTSGDTLPRLVATPARQPVAEVGFHNR